MAKRPAWAKDPMYINWKGLIIALLSLFAVVAVVREYNLVKQIKMLKTQQLNCPPPSKPMCVTVGQRS